MSQEIRLFVGNIPPDVEESALRAEFSHYGKVTQVQIKEKKGIEDDIDKFAFVNLETDHYRVNKCISEFSQHEFNGRLLRVSIAKESFMDRLKREREAEKDKGKNTTPDKSCNASYENEKEKKPASDRLDFHIDIPIKLKNKICNNQHIQNDHFQDSPSLKKRLKISNPKEEILKSLKDPPKVQESTVSSANVDKILTPSDIKRLEAIKNMKEEYLKKKNLLKNTLLNIDNKSNKKILFDEDGEAVVNDDSKTKKTTSEKFNSDNSEYNFSASKIKNYTNRSNRKVGNKDKQLFDEESDGNEDEYNFEIKQQFQGAAGQKLIELQSRYKSDKRFVLDERFIEEDNDKDPAEMLDTIESMEDNEKSKQMEILEGVLGTSLSSNINNASKKTSFKTMLRYDPTRTDHSKFINDPQKLDSNKINLKKKKLEKPSDDGAEDENAKQVPIVSQDRYYKVDGSLKQAMEDKNPFSLLSLFGSEKAEDSKSEKYSFEVIDKVESKVKNPISTSKNPFYYDSSDSDDNEADKETAEKECLVTGNTVEEANDRAKPLSIVEKLFFSDCDKRLREGLEFFLNKNEISNESRDKLKFIVKKRIHNNMRNDHYRTEKAGRRHARLTKFKRKK